MGDGRHDGDPFGSPPPVELTPRSEPGEPDGPRRRRGTGIAIAAIALVCIIAIVGVVVATRDNSSEHRVSHRVVTGPAGRALFAALGTTTGAGSYTATFNFLSTPGRAPAPPHTIPCPDQNGDSNTVIVTPDGAEVRSSSSYSCATAAAPQQNVSVTGHATVNTDPYRMVAESQVTGFGAITVRVDSTRLWETGGGNYGLDPGSSAGSGSSLSGFASLVGSTLGPGQGALTMITLASPNGYLNLEKQAVSGVTPAGNGTVDGAPVTYYEVAVDPAMLLHVPGLSGEQTKTITQGLAGLQQAGYRSTLVKVGVDDAGFIRETTSVATFSDGSRMTSTTTLSNFGCAGTVLLPGDPPASSAPTTPCVSPDTGTTTTSTSTTTTSDPNEQTATHDSSTTTSSTTATATPG